VSKAADRAAAPPADGRAGRDGIRAAGLTIAADGSYAARLSGPPGGGGHPERWTLDSPEPYAVPLPGPRPESPDSALLPLADGRVLIVRRAAGHHLLALLYPTGPDTGELFLGAVEFEQLTLLPPAPCGLRAYALVHGEHSTGVWLVADCAGGAERPYPQRVAEVPGRCSGGAWLDRAGRLLALDRTDVEGDGRTKTVAVDLARDGAVSPLLEIAEDSDDRLLLADPDSGLLLVRSNAPGADRLGWGVLGSHRPVRFPAALHPEGAVLTPFAVQPGQMLLPEDCAVALCGRTVQGGGTAEPGHGAAGPGGGDAPDGPGGAAEGTYGQRWAPALGRPWLAVWRPARRELVRFPAPRGWFTGCGVWTEGGELRLPYATPQSPCGLARLRLPSPHRGGGSGTRRANGGAAPREEPPAPAAAAAPGTAADVAPGAASAPPGPDCPDSGASSYDAADGSVRTAEAAEAEETAAGSARNAAERAAESPAPAAVSGQPKPVPLQQALLGGLSAPARAEPAAVGAPVARPVSVGTRRV